jgi:hypothetical protein
VLRDAMAVDSLDSCGIYFGTTGGQVYVSADAGDNGTANKCCILWIGQPIFPTFEELAAARRARPPAARTTLESRTAIGSIAPRP